MTSNSYETGDWAITVARLILGMLVLSSLACAARHGQDPPELAAYVAQVRSNRTSALAEIELQSAAVLITGDAIRFAQQDSLTRHWSVGYMSTSCPAPGTDSLTIARQNRVQELRMASVMAALRRLGDTDRSGFVTDREGETLRGVIDFGYLVQRLAEKGVFSTSEIAAAVPIPEERVSARLVEYNALATKWNSTMPQRLPEIPLSPAPEPAP